MKYIKDIIADIVAKVKEQTTVYYMFGNWKELCIDLAEKGESQTFATMRYPLILLHNDFKETFDKNKSDVEVSGLNIYIIDQTPESQKSTTERCEGIYKSSLNPLYEMFLHQMKQNRYIKSSLGNIEHIKKDLYKLYVGDNQNRLPDFLDSVQIEFRNLTYYKTNC